MDDEAEPLLIAAMANIRPVRRLDTHPWTHIHYDPLFDDLEMSVVPHRSGGAPWNWEWTVMLEGHIHRADKVWRVEVIDTNNSSRLALRDYLTLMDRLIAGDPDAAIRLANLLLERWELVEIGADVEQGDLSGWTDDDDVVF